MVSMKKLTFALFILFLLLITPELALQALDPLRVKPYFADLDALFATMQADATRVYVHTPGVYTFSNWRATINADSTRLVPDTTPQDCTIALVGDSATFGHGVNDAETWANQLARRYPAVEILNTGVNGYNIQQVQATIAAVSADGYLYAMISNDADAVLEYPRKPTPVKPMIEVYAYIVRTRLARQTTSTPDWHSFDVTLAELKALDNVAMVGFAGDSLAQRADIPLLPYWTHNNSPTDTHADAQGNIEIADSVDVEFAALVERVC